jgi:hypothetical protein
VVGGAARNDAVATKIRSNKIGRIGWVLDRPLAQLFNSRERGYRGQIGLRNPPERGALRTSKCLR